MRSIFTIALKDLLELSRDKFGLFWVIGFPLIMAVFFGMILSFGGKGTMGIMYVGLINDDKSAYADTFIKNLHQRESLSIQPYALDSAERMVRLGKLTAYIHLKKGFGDNMGIYGKDNDSLEIGIDPSRKAESGYLQGMIVQSLFESMQYMMKDKTFMQDKIRVRKQDIQSDTTLSLGEKKNTSQFFSAMENYYANMDTTAKQSGPMGGGDAKTSLKIKSISRDYKGKPRSSFDITFPSAILWGIIACANAFAISMVSERRKGTYHRLRMTPIHSFQILLGKGTACFLACLGSNLFLLLLGYWVFHVRASTPIFLLMTSFCTAWCFVGIMSLISVLGKTEQVVGDSTWGISLIMMMFGGGMIPLIAMPVWMQKASNFSPVKWGIYSMEGAIWRDFSFSEMLFSWSLLLSVGLIAFCIGWFRMRKMDSQ